MLVTIKVPRKRLVVTIGEEHFFPRAIGHSRSGNLSAFFLGRRGVTIITVS